MLKSLLRVLAGFILACVAAGFCHVVFATNPFGTPVSEIGTLELTLLAATHFTLFAAPFVFIAAAIAEWQSIRSLSYYALAATAIAFAGFAAQYASEGTDLTILNDYAIRAFLTAGFAAGLVYWMVAGRSAGEDREAEQTGLDIASLTTTRPSKCR